MLTYKKHARGIRPYDYYEAGDRLQTLKEALWRIVQENIRD